MANEHIERSITSIVVKANSLELLVTEVRGFIIFSGSIATAEYGAIHVTGEYARAKLVSVIRPLGAASQTQILQELFWKPKIAMDIIQHNLDASHPYFVNRRSDVPYPSVLVEIPRFGASTPDNPAKRGYWTILVLVLKTVLCDRRPLSFKDGLSSSIF